jgi:hypothetical protein
MSNGNVPTQAGPSRILAAGFLGGLMTPLLPPLKEMLASHHTPSDFSFAYWILAVALGVLGLVMVWLLSETDVKKALVLGLSLPAFFTSIGGAVQNDKSAGGPTQTQKPAFAPLGIILPTANAQEAAPAANGPPPSRSIEISVEGQLFGYKLELLDSKGAVVGESIDISSTESVMIAKPLSPAVTAARFTVDDQPPVIEKFAAKDGYTVAVTLRGLKFTRRFSFAQVLGKTPDLIPDGVSASVEVKPKTSVGVQGWIYLGVFHNGSWQSEHTVEGADLPKAGESKQIIISANLREAPGLANRALSIIWVFQRIRIIDVTMIRDVAWAHVEVVG